MGDVSVIQHKHYQEYFEMKCCSLKRKNLQNHFTHMSKKYYLLGGSQDPNLRHIFIISLPIELQPKLHRMLNSLQREVSQLTLGEIYQLTLTTLDKLCEQHKFTNLVEFQYAKSFNIKTKKLLEFETLWY